MGELGYDYSGCRILVVGGTRGAGWSTAQAFREFGADVVVTGTHYLTTFYEADLAGLTYRQLDLTDPDQIQDFADRLGPIDVLVNAAGSRLPYGAAGPEREFIVQAARLSLAGPLFLANKLRGRLASSPASGGGAVINLPGTRAWWELGQEVTDLDYPGHIRRLGASWLRHNVRFNAIVQGPQIPGQAKGSVVRHPADQPPGLGHESTHRAGAVRTLPRSSSLIEPEVAALALFLGSAGAVGLSGQTLTVHGALRDRT